MAHSNNDEPRRLWRPAQIHQRAQCVSCGSRSSAHSRGLPFCDTCLDWARQSKLDEWDDLGTGD